MASPFYLSSDGIHERRMFFHPHFVEVPFKAVSIKSSNKGVTAQGGALC